MRQRMIATHDVFLDAAGGVVAGGDPAAAVLVVRKGKIVPADLVAAVEALGKPKRGRPPGSGMKESEPAADKSVKPERSKQRVKRDV